MWQERVEIVKKMTVAVSDAARAKDQYSLLILWYGAVCGGRGFEGGGLGEGFVYRSHNEFRG